MPVPKWYSPQIRRDLVKKLYFRAKAEGIPMTKLTDRLIEHGLNVGAQPYEEITTRVAEEPHQATEPR